MSVTLRRATALACADLQFSLSWEPEGLTLTTKPVNTLAAGRLSHILWPSTLGLSSWTFATELFKQNLHSTAKYFGLDSMLRDSLDGSTSNRAGRVPSGSGFGAASGNSQPLAKSQPEAHGAKDQDAQASSDAQATSGSESISEAPTMSPTSSTTSPKASGPDAETARSTIAKDVYGVRQMSEHTKGPREAMMKTFMRNFRPARPLPPRGSVYFTGLVQISNQEAVVTLEVVAYWDPAEKKWWPQMDIRMKQVQTNANAKLKPPPR